MEQLFENGELFLTFGKKWPVFKGLRRKKILAIPIENAYTQGVWWGKVRGIEEPPPDLSPPGLYRLVAL